MGSIFRKSICISLATGTIRFVTGRGLSLLIYLYKVNKNKGKINPGKDGKHKS
jgi:hypothetical protein